MPYWRLFYRLVWATKERRPLIDAVVATAVVRSLRATCDEPGVRVFAIGMMPDHVHVAVSIPPRLALADFVRRLKGASSYAANGLITARARPASPGKASTASSPSARRPFPTLLPTSATNRLATPPTTSGQPLNASPSLPSPFSGLRPGQPGVFNPGRPGHGAPR